MQPYYAALRTGKSFGSRERSSLPSGRQETRTPRATGFEPQRAIGRAPLAPAGPLADIKFSTSGSIRRHTNMRPAARLSRREALQTITAGTLATRGALAGEEPFRFG